MTRENQRIDSEDKLYLAKINKVVDTARRDVTDRKIFVDLPFNGSSPLTSFIDNLRTETMARQGWEALFIIRTTNGKIIQLLERFNSIKEDKIKNEKAKQTPGRSTTSRRTCTSRCGAHYLPLPKEK